MNKYIVRPNCDRTCDAKGIIEQNCGKHNFLKKILFFNTVKMEVPTSWITQPIIRSRSRSSNSEKKITETPRAPDITFEALKMAYHRTPPVNVSHLPPEEKQNIVRFYDGDTTMTKRLDDEDEEILRDSYIVKIQSLHRQNPNFPFDPIDLEKAPYHELRSYFRTVSLKVERASYNRVGGGDILMKLKINEETFRADYRVKFEMIEKLCPNLKFPTNFDILTCDKVHDIYKSYRSQAEITIRYNDIKSWVMIGWLIVELAGTWIFQLPLTGYIEKQKKLIKKYDMYLYEMAKKKHATSEATAEIWNPEYRLVGLMIVQAAIMIGGGLLATKLGIPKDKMDNVINLVNQWSEGSDSTEQLDKVDEASSSYQPPERTEDGGTLGSILNMFSGGNNLDSLMSMAQTFMGGGQPATVKRPRRPLHRRDDD